MSTISTIPAARTSLYAILRTLQSTTLVNVGVYRTGAWSQRDDNEDIAVLNARNVNRDYPTLKADWYEETYIIPVQVRVFDSGADVTITETRLHALIVIVEDAILGSGGGQADLGVAGVQTAYPTGMASPGEESGPVENDVLMARATIEIRVKAMVGV